MTNKFNLLPLVALMSTAFAAQGQQVAYSPEMLRALVPNGGKVDISYFEKGYDVLPGVHRVTVNYNGELHKTGSYEFREFQGRLEPVFKVSDLKYFSLKPEVLNKFSNLPSTAEVFPLFKYIEGAKTEFDSSEQILDVRVPQIFLVENSGWVDIAPQEEWDYGETAAIVNYTMSASHNRSRIESANSSNFNGNLNAQFNLGAWRLYSSGSFYAAHQAWAEGSSNSHEWNIWNTYLQRDLPAITSTMQFGEISTSGEIFDSIPMRGMRVFTNESMLPQSARSFSPVIEGIANSNAQILIRQNGNIVYTLNVSAGPFRLENLPSFGSYGDLEVIIREADGTERVMLVPYSSVPMMLKEGQFRYDINVGRYYRKHMVGDHKEPNFFMGTLSYGLPHDITMYGGSILAAGYHAGAVGVGVSLGKFGAVAADVTQSRNSSDYSRGLKEASGAAWRVRYEKTMTTTGTTVNLANYQYITGNYMSLNDFAEYTGYASNYFLKGRLKSQWQLSLSQSLGDYGNVYLGGSYARYHDDTSDTKTFNVGYNTSIKNIGVGLNYYRNYHKLGFADSKDWESSHTMMLNLSIPLHVIFGGNVSNDIVNGTTVSYQGTMDRNPNGETDYRQSVVMSGYSRDNNLNWRISQDLGGNQERATDLNVAYTGDYFNADVGYSLRKYMHHYQIGMNGALVFHKTGLTPSTPVYDSAVLVEVPGISGVRVKQAFDSSTDYFGHGVLTYLRNYSRNEVSIDPATLPNGAVLLDSSSQIVVPTEGALVRVKYPVRMGQQAVFRLLDSSAQPLPFGTVVRLKSQESDATGVYDPFVSGLVGSDGRVYLTGLPDRGTLLIDSNKPDKKLFKFNYKLLTDLEENQSTLVDVPVIEVIANMGNEEK